MFLLETSESFRKLANEVTIRCEDLVPHAEGVWTWTQRISQIAPAAEMMRKFNSEPDKALRIKKTHPGASRKAGPLGVWLRDGIGPRGGELMCAIAMPAPHQPGSTMTEDEGLADGGDLMGTLAPEPEIVIKELRQGIYTDRDWKPNPGDILQLNEEEEIKVQRGGIGLIIVLYKLGENPTPDKRDS